MAATTNGSLSMNEVVVDKSTSSGEGSVSVREIDHSDCGTNSSRTISVASYLEPGKPVSASPKCNTASLQNDDT